MWSGLRRGVSGSSRWSERAANEIHSLSGARARMSVDRERKDSWLACEARDCHSSKVCQAD